MGADDPSPEEVPAIASDAPATASDDPATASDDPATASDLSINTTFDPPLNLAGQSL